MQQVDAQRVHFSTQMKEQHVYVCVHAHAHTNPKPPCQKGEVGNCINELQNVTLLHTNPFRGEIMIDCNLILPRFINCNQLWCHSGPSRTKATNQVENALSPLIHGRDAIGCIQDKTKSALRTRTSASFPVSIHPSKYSDLVAVFWHASKVNNLMGYEPMTSQ